MLRIVSIKLQSKKEFSSKDSFSSIIEEESARFEDIHFASAPCLPTIVKFLKQYDPSTGVILAQELFLPERLGQSNPEPGRERKRETVIQYFKISSNSIFYQILLSLVVY